jgi:hypothetical protein
LPKNQTLQVAPEGIVRRKWELILPLKKRRDNGENPYQNERSGDEICVIGTDAQVKEFKTYLHQHEFEAPKKLKNGNYIATTGIK